MRCAAWFYMPSGHATVKRVPVIVMAHGLAGIRAARLDAFAERFAALGYACLVFDYRCFGGSEGEPRCFVDIQNQLADWSSAVSYARTLPGVDPEQVVLWGTSLAGGHVIKTASHDRRIAAVILQCPFTDGIASSIRTRPLVALRLVYRGLRDQWTARSGGEPVRVPVAARPGAVGLLTAEDTAAGYHRIFEAAGIFEPELDVPARIALRIPLYRPGVHLREVHCPALVCVSRNDTATPAWATLRHLRGAPQAEILLYDMGHFDFYVGPGFETCVVDQIAFLQAKVPLNGS
ncbi:hypothetical protein BKG85_08905 [Mycobacteroides chelonae]|nr:hypothetical protein BKG85_08905 [Mycobacteroides chelonae]